MTTFNNKEHHLSLSLGLTSSASTPSAAASPPNHEMRTGSGSVPVGPGVRTQAAAMPFQMMFSSAPQSVGGGFYPFGSTNFFKYNHLPWAESASVPFNDPNSEMPRAEARASSSLRGIDVNRMPAADTEDDDAGVSSPNSTISSVSGKRTERDNNNNLNNENNAGGCDDDMAERTSSRDGGVGGGSDEDDGDTSRKKLRLSRDQSALLEETFKEHSTLNPKQKLALAKRLGLRPRQVEVWFQNRRARTKLKQTEVDCEFLKRCCEQLTEENRRLQKEVQDLRALKLSPQFYMQMTPPTTLTMCPSCERVGVPPVNGPVVDPRGGNPTTGQRPGPVHPSWISSGPAPVAHHGPR
ncbi:Homeobox-leucine zipper protein HAT2-like protein [Drosera capensis]